MKLALVQFDPQLGQTAANLETTDSLLKTVSTDIDVVVLPELFSSGYTFTSQDEVDGLCDPLDGEVVQALTQWAKRGDMAIAAGWAEAAPGGPFNSAVLVGPDGVLSHYRKVHLFDRETLWFQPGDLGFNVVEFRGVKLGMMVCFDWRFPESARSLAMLGADVILHPSNLVLPWCPDAMITRALENNVFIATADRWGTETAGDVSLKFIGRSQVVAPRGQRLGQLGESETAVLEVEIDPALARNKQVTTHNNLWDDRREEHYVHSPRP